MEHLLVTYGMELGILNRKTHGYLSCENGGMSIHGRGIHPFFKTKHFDHAIIPEEFYMFNHQSPEHRGPITFGSQVSIVSREGLYFIVNEDGEILAEKQPESNTITRRFGKWTLLLKDDHNSQRNVLSIDEIIFKSVHGNYLRCEENGKITSATSVVTESVIWNIPKASVPYIPAWMHTRPYISASHLLPSFESYLKAPGNAVDTYKSGMLNTIKNQENVLIEELLYVLLSIDGQLIRKKPDPAEERYRYYVDSMANLDGSLVRLVEKVLPLCEHHDKLMVFIHKYSNFEYGLVFQALCNAMKSVRRDYVSLINILDTEFEAGKMTLQRLWHEVQKPIKIFEALSQLIDRLEANLDKSPLSTTYQYLITSADNEIHQLIFFLFGKAVYPFLEMLGKWIYYGLIDDDFKEFMIGEKKDEDDSDFENFDWDERFMIRQSYIPKFLLRQANEIFCTGKYLNVIKAYDKSRQCPFSGDLLQNYEEYLEKQDFSECISRAYQWANQELVKIIMEEKNLLGRLESMKQYFFLQSGDFLVHFLDGAEEELLKDSKLISQTKLQSLLEMGIRTSSADKDPYKDDVFCFLTAYTTVEILYAYNNLLGSQEQKVAKTIMQPGDDLQPNKKSQKGHTLFNLDYKVEWPLNIILSKRVIMKYQILFRYLFAFKFNERRLNHFWHNFMSLKDLDSNRLLSPVYFLLQKMLHFLKNIIYNICYEVIEKRWTKLKDGLKNVKTFEEIISLHDGFISGCMRDTLLSEQEFFNLVTRINQLCLVFVKMFLPIPKEVRIQVQSGNFGESGIEIAEDQEDMTPAERRRYSKRQESEKIKSLISQQSYINCEKFTVKYDLQMNELMAMIQKLQVNYEQGLTHLYQRLDFNSFYQRKMLDL